MKTGTGKHKSVTFNHGKPTKPKSGSSRSIRTINPMMRTKERRSPRTTCSEGPRGAGSTEWGGWRGEHGVGSTDTGSTGTGSTESGSTAWGARSWEHGMASTMWGARCEERLDFLGEGELRTHVPRTRARLRPQGSVPEVCGSAGCSQAGRVLLTGWGPEAADPSSPGSPHLKALPGPKRLQR